jgi:hypothetical protein
MTVMEIIENVIKDLEAIDVPVSKIESIGIPISRSVNGLKACINAWNDADNKEKAKTDEEPVVELVQIDDSSEEN